MAVIYFYDMGEGRTYTKSQVAEMYAAARTVAERNKLSAELAHATRVPVQFMSVKQPFPPLIITNVWWTNKSVAQALNGTLTPIIPTSLQGQDLEIADSRYLKQHAAVKVLDRVIMLPPWRQYALSYPMRRSATALKSWIDDLTQMGIGYRVIEATDDKGRRLTYTEIAPLSPTITMAERARERRNLAAQGSTAHTLLPYLRIKFDFAIPEFAKKGETIPFYNFTNSTIPYWAEFTQRMYNGLTEGKYGTEEAVKQGIAIYDKLNAFAQTHYFGNGTLQGMIGRISVMQEYRIKYRSQHQSRTDSEHRRIRRLVQDYMPLREFRGVTFNTPDVSALLEQEIALTAPDGKLITRPLTRRINGASNPGPWYSNVLVDPSDHTLGRMKRRDVAFIEPLICTQILVDCSKKFVDTKEYDKKSEIPIEAFWEKWKSIKLFNLFPKPEVYAIADRYRKTRCIAAYNSAPMIPVQILMQPIVDSIITSLKCPTILQPDPERSKLTRAHAKSMSLFMTKQSAFKGAASDIMRIITHARNWPIDTHYLGIYADNLYVIIREAHCVRWVSFDGVKAESAITQSDVRQALTLLNEINDANNYKYEITAATGLFPNYYNNVFPTLAAEGIGLLGNQQILYPAMGSGVMGTFFFNCYKMADLVLECVNNSTRPFITPTQEFSSTCKKAMERVGYSLTIEYVEDFPLEDSPLVPYRKMDLLGFDFGVFKITNTESVYFTVLRESSLFGLLLYRKEYYNEFGVTKLSELEQAYLGLIRMRTAFMMGAWYYPPIMKTVLSFAERFKTKMATSVETGLLEELDQEELYQLLFGESSEEFDMREQMQSLLSLVVLPTLPTVFELIILQTNDAEMARRAVAARVGIIPYIYLAPISVLQEMGYDIEQVETEYELPERELFKIYPTMKSGDVAYMTSKTVMISGAPTGIVKDAFKVIKIKGEKARNVINQDVGRPATLSAPVKRVKKPAAFQHFVDWTKDMMTKGKVVYRLPIPLQYVGREADIENEHNVALATLRSAIVEGTGYDEDEIDPYLKKMSNVTFIVKPRTHLTGIEGDPRALVPGRVISRQFVT